MIRHIKKFSLSETKIELTPGHRNKSHYAHRVQNPELYRSFLLLECGTSHVYDMFISWDYFIETAENRSYRMDYDICYTSDYLEAFGKAPVPMRAVYYLNNVVHIYDSKGWFLRTVKTAYSASHIVDGWCQGTHWCTKRASRKGLYYSSYLRERIYTKIYDWYPGFEADAEKKGLEICTW